MKKQYVKRTKYKRGMPFGRLTVIGRPYYVGQSIHVPCQCKCGRKVSPAMGRLKSKHTQSCGCLKREKSAYRQLKHGGCGSRLYNIWKGIRARCNSPSEPQYRRYGACGITVCRAWSSFPAFRDWALSNGYAPGLTIDRRRNSRGYSPSNCRWATRSGQAINRRKRSGTTSRFIGVTWNRRKERWRAQVKVGGKIVFRGDFRSEAEASHARDIAARQYHGGYAVLNWPQGRGT